MSKIFDALRKAEMEMKRPRRSARRRPPSAKVATGRETTFVRDMDSIFRQSLLNLRNSIDSEMRQKESRVVMFTSAIKGEGKTAICTLLARILALNERERVLIVDCSINNPSIHELFGVTQEVGIIDYLSGETEFEKVVKSPESGFLDIVTIGEVKGGDITQPLFNSERMNRFIKEASEKYDYVLIDTSAILEAAETSIISSFADGSVMIIQAGKTKREVIKRSMLMVEKLGGKFIGTVLNRKKYYIPEFIYKRV